MAAFLQRYVLENEHLRLSKAKAEESAADAIERLRQTEGKLVKALAAPPAPLRGGPESMMIGARKATWAVGMYRGGGQGRGLEAGSGGRRGGPGGGGGQGRNPEGEAAQPSPPGGRGGVVSAVTQAEKAIRRLTGRADGAGDTLLGTSASGDGGGGDGSGDDSRRGGSTSRGRSCGRCRSQRAATVSAKGELGYTRGLVAELSFLLSATEGERDSLASLLVLAERRMDQLVVTQEELALNLAWKNVSAMEKQHLSRLGRDQRVSQLRLHQQQGRGGGPGYEAEGGGEVAIAPSYSTFSLGQEAGSTATQQQDRQDQQNRQNKYDKQGQQDQHDQQDLLDEQHSLFLEQEQGVGKNIYPPVEGTRSAPAASAAAAAAAATTTITSATTFEQSRSALEALELRRRVRELEALQKAAEIGLREIEAENRRLKRRCRGGLPPPWMSWGDGGGVVGSTAGEERCGPLRQESSGEMTMSTMVTRPPGRNRCSDTAEARPGGRRGRRGGSGSKDDDDHDDENNVTPGVEGYDLSVKSSADDCSLSLPMLSAAEIGSGSCNSNSDSNNITNTNTNKNSRNGGEFTHGSGRAGTAGAKAGITPCLDDEQPHGWGWGGGAVAAPRPGGRCRPRSSPFCAQGEQECTDGDWPHHRQQQQSQQQQPQPQQFRYWQHRGVWRGEYRNNGSRDEGADAGTSDDNDNDDDNDDYGSILIKGKLAWVLGLPAGTTSENELLAEVMHLVVERGKATTDADVLEAQLRKMDDQALAIGRLMASTTHTSPVGGGGGDHGLDRRRSTPPADGGRVVSRRGRRRRSGSGSDLSVVDIGAGGGFSSDATFLSSLFNDDAAGDATGSPAGGRRVCHKTTTGAGGSATSPKHAQDAAGAGRPRDDHDITPRKKAAGAAAVAAETASTRRKPQKPGRGGREVAVPAPHGQRREATAAESSRSGKPEEVGAAAGGAGPAAGSTALREPAGGCREEPVDDGNTRTSFSKTLRGRVVSIDVFCTKVGAVDARFDWKIELLARVIEELSICYPAQPTARYLVSGRLAAA